jgi:hypothetical protein
MFGTALNAACSRFCSAATQDERTELVLSASQQAGAEQRHMLVQRLCFEQDAPKR